MATITCMFCLYEGPEHDVFGQQCLRDTAKRISELETQLDRASKSLVLHARIANLEANLRAAASWVRVQQERAEDAEAEIQRKNKALREIEAIARERSYHYEVGKLAHDAL